MNGLENSCDGNKTYWKGDEQILLDFLAGSFGAYLTF